MTSLADPVHEPRLPVVDPRTRAVANLSGDASLEAAELGRMSSIARVEGRLVDAYVLAVDALRLAEQSGDRSTEGCVLQSMGSILLDAGDAAEALATCRRSREICRDIGDHRAERAALDTMARIHRFRGDLERASLNFEAALAVGRGDGDDAADATTMVELAAVRLLLGDAAHAAELADEALVLARARVAAVLPSIAPVAAEVIATNGAPDEARHLLIEVLDQEPADESVRAGILLALGRIDGRVGEPREAARRFEDALASARSVGRLDLEARVLEARTDVHKALGDAQSAILDLERRLQLVESSSAERLATRVEMLRLVHDENESRSRADVLDRLIG